ncbi:MAG TPA: hypothetical protein VGL97_19585 [Bryobacteraceae bacterium]
MWFQNSHLSDQQLLMELDGELSGSEAKQILAHLGACWKCRARRQELDRAIVDFVRARQHEFDEKLPPPAGPRALLKARLAELSANEPPSRGWAWVFAAAACGLLCFGVLLVRSTAGRQNRPHAVIVSVPNSRITPGATILISRQAVCTEANTNNKDVPVAVQQQVFAAYGIPAAEPREYEVDYLVTPALGGADDIRNLWPQSHSETVWNSEVKDALETRLRQMVCAGQLDLPEAQQEIAANWIAAYKKYFHTEAPLAIHDKQRN